MVPRGERVCNARGIRFACPFLPRSRVCTGCRHGWGWGYSTGLRRLCRHGAEGLLSAHLFGFSVKGTTASADTRNTRGCKQEKAGALLGPRPHLSCSVTGPLHTAAWMAEPPSPLQLGYSAAKDLVSGTDFYGFIMMG